MANPPLGPAICVVRRTSHALEGVSVDFVAVLAVVAESGVVLSLLSLLSSEWLLIHFSRSSPCCRWNHPFYFCVGPSEEVPIRPCKEGYLRSQGIVLLDRFVDAASDQGLVERCLFAYALHHS